MSFAIAIIGVCIVLAMAEVADFAADPDLYARGGSTFGDGRRF
jgi:hypothetical protein